MRRETDRPAKPPPLLPGDEASKAAWRDYLVACAKADEQLLRKAPQQNALAERMN
ncbi:MAG: hypothetical protein AAF415_07520 [Pseudomonadota bacterium]